ncbi:MAG TPA: transglutaminase family protein [Pyrinomonadaceae bacterium]|nr:transglutaminase family protein [Pyrinomonadaceae bacterium]
MMRYRVGCQLSYQVDGPATFVFNVAPTTNDVQRVIAEKLWTEPALEVEDFTLTEANRFHRIVVPRASAFQLNYDATVEISHVIRHPAEMGEGSVDRLPPSTLIYFSPSRYCQSDKLIRLAQHYFGSLLPGHSRVTAVCNWIYDNVEYLRGTTDVHTSAFDTATERAGVCRDFAHLGIAICRALNIPARFLTTYAYNLQPPDFHACFEAYLGDRWHVFDATRLAPLTGLVRIGVGRDAADTPFASIFGPVTMTDMKINCTVEGAPLPAYTTDAVAIS